MDSAEAGQYSAGQYSQSGCGRQSGLQWGTAVRGEGRPGATNSCCGMLRRWYGFHAPCPCRAMSHAVLCCVQDRPSIRYIRDVLRMRSSAFIEMRFVRPTAALMTAMEAAGGPGSKRAESCARRTAAGAGFECSSLQGSCTLPLALESLQPSSCSSIQDRRLQLHRRLTIRRPRSEYACCCTDV